MTANSSIVFKVNGIVLAMTVLAIASSAFLICRLLSQQALFDALLHEEVAQLDQARLMESDFKKQVQEWKDYLLRGQDADQRAHYAAAFKGQAQIVDKDLDNLEAACSDAHVHALVQGLHDAHRSLMAKYLDAMRHAEAGPAWDGRIADAAVNGLDRPPTDLADQIDAALTQLTHDRSQAFSDSTTQAVIILSILLPLVFIVALITAIRLMRSLSRSLTDMAGILEQVSKGDFTSKAPATRNDEVGMMARSLNQTVSRLQGTLTRVVALAGGVHARAAALELISAKLSTSASQETEQASVIGSSTKNVSLAIESIASGAEEMEASIKELSSSAVRASQISTQASRKASDANSLVGHLEHSSKQIDVVLKNISTIAEQTNLLALNASIEAARAGEAGMSFRVVANEVKQLARQTAAAVASTAQIMSGFQSQSKAAATAIDAIANEVTRISDILTSVASAVEEQAATTGEMNRNIIGVAASARTSAENVDHVVSAARTTSASASETRESAQTLVQIAGELQTMVGEFKL
jgi:methyl-accepting chemotaxis protein